MLQLGASSTPRARAPTQAIEPHLDNYILLLFAINLGDAVLAA